jgi:hypothetical protein
VVLEVQLQPVAMAVAEGGVVEVAAVREEMELMALVLLLE